MTRTKTKLESASRYGARYGSPLKKKIKEIERIQKTKQVCPQCGRKSLKRKGYSIWQCSKCKTKLAGGAYKPTTSSGREAKRVVRKEEEREQKIQELKTKEEQKEKEE